jgi:hypothetical protein
MLKYDLQIDQKLFDKKIRKLTKGLINRKARSVLKFIGNDGRLFVRDKLIPRLDVVRQSGTTRPFTKSAPRYKANYKGRLLTLIYINREQATYLRNAVDSKGNKRGIYTKHPNKRYLLYPEKDYKHSLRYGQPNKKGGVVKDGDFSLPNRHGGRTLFTVNQIRFKRRTFRFDKGLYSGYVGNHKRYSKKLTDYVLKDINKTR